MARSLAWLVLLLMFFQLPYYKSEVGPLYALAKIWPLLLAPLVIYGVIALRLPDRVLYLCVAVYALAVTPFLSMLHYPNDLIDALAASAKAWPLTFYFSAAAALILLRPSERLLAHCMIGLGAATFVLMVFLWIVIPAAWYQPGSFGSDIFSWDEGRGSYIRMPMMLGMVTIFWLAQRLARERDWLPGVLLLAGLACMLLIYKARLPIGVAFLIVLMILALQLPLLWRWAVGAVLALPAALAAMLIGPALPGLIEATFDESLFVRLRSLTVAWQWLMESPLRVVFGGGSISTLSSFTMADHFNAPDFWITDIGWLGVLMEYGIIGTVLILLIHARAFFQAHRVSRGDPFRAALANCVLFEILCSGVYSVMYAPGPVVTIAAIAWWLKLRDHAGLKRREAWHGFGQNLTNFPKNTAPRWAKDHIPRGA